MSLLSRRAVLRGGLSLAAFGGSPAAALRINPDVVVIGAGAAGLAATETLLKSGKTVLCVEASGRTGGRVHTDIDFFGVPYDMGAHWLHVGHRNPFVDYGLESGFDIYKENSDSITYVGDRVATKEEARAFDSAYDNVIAAISTAAENRRDVAPSTVVPHQGEWNATAHLHVGPYSMGKDLDRFSCLDWYNSAEGSDWFCREGFGTLLQHRFRDVPVSLNTAVAAVRWDSTGVQIETNNGTIAAKACILTVSTGVLASGAIRFDPPLPAEKQESFNGITMGSYNHVAMQFKENFFGVGGDGYVSYKVTEQNGLQPKGVGLMVNVGGTNLSLADIGGSLGVELEAAGADAMIDFALGELESVFGSQVRHNLIKAHATNWGLNPYVVGAYASAEPGAYPQRKVLRQSVGDRIFFAGEATSEDEWATVAGAHKEGIRVASRVAGLV